MTSSRYRGDDVIRSNKFDDIVIATTDRKKPTGKKTYINIDRNTELPESLPKVDKNVYINKYRTFIIKLLSERGNVKDKEAEKYTDEVGMAVFVKAMTHDSYNPFDRTDNYELLEHLGDATVNKCATWYLSGRFLDIMNMGKDGVEILSMQKALITSKLYLSKYSDILKLSQFIRFRPLQYVFNKGGSTDNTTAITQVMDRSMREDTFEAFFAAMEMVIDGKEGLRGVGYSVASNILSSFFGEQIIPSTTRELKDFKSQFKEVFLDKRDGDTAIYEQFGPHNRRLTIVMNGNSNSVVKKKVTKVFEISTISIGGDASKEYDFNVKIADKQLSKMALEWLQDNYSGAKEFIYRPNEI